jgi:hypothetical protein
MLKECAIELKDMIGRLDEDGKLRNHFEFHAGMVRYALGTKNKSLKYNSDGSLTIYLGNHSPGADKESNWLPAPNGEFSIWLRAYWPDESILTGTWKPPIIARAAASAARTVGR